MLSSVLSVSACVHVSTVSVCISVWAHGCGPACIATLQGYHIVLRPQNREPAMVMATANPFLGFVFIFACDISRQRTIFVLLPFPFLSPWPVDNVSPYLYSLHVLVQYRYCTRYCKGRIDEIYGLFASVCSVLIGLFVYETCLHCAI